MKKIILVALIFAGCKKEQTCVCSTVVNGTVIATEHRNFKSTDRDASRLCNAEETETTGTQTITSKCEVW